MASPTAPLPSITKHDLEIRLIEKCWKDPEFRKQVIADPKGTFERQFGRPLPADLKIVIHEDSANTINLTLPPTPGNIAELSDEELERVAGGGGAVPPTVVAIPTISGIATSIVFSVAAAQGNSSPSW